MKLLKKQRGFTLVELVATTVILGVLAAVAIPKFIDLKGDSAQASVKGIADTLTTAGNANYATRSVTPTAGFASIKQSCSDFTPNLFDSKVLPDGFKASGASSMISGNNICTLTRKDSDGSEKTADFVIIGVN
ncbi:Fimbrial protein [Polaromonas vacuolata]|uniref:Fimbrial protein n=1 Tax=Polaromonas vacuolata TaxID=37448 RepID=A0A6H2HE05_9BURK|nr:type II secretion system protein [Polaromonas vacuolata]QJC58060.1 Fimbrial protein [Polaromonas vacuolata]